MLRSQRLSKDLAGLDVSLQQADSVNSWLAAWLCGIAKEPKSHRAIISADSDAGTLIELHGESGEPSGGFVYITKKSSEVRAIHVTPSLDANSEIKIRSESEMNAALRAAVASYEYRRKCLDRYGLLTLGITCLTLFVVWYGLLYYFRR